MKKIYEDLITFKEEYSNPTSRMNHFLTPGIVMFYTFVELMSLIESQVIVNRYISKFILTALTSLSFQQERIYRSNHNSRY